MRKKHSVKFVFVTQEVLQVVLVFLNTARFRQEKVCVVIARVPEQHAAKLLDQNACHSGGMAWQGEGLDGDAAQVKKLPIL